MRKTLIVLFVMISAAANGQHCLWDCTGFLMIKTDATKAEMDMMRPVLVDAQKHVVIDTLYGTGKETFDTCRFLYFDDFVKYRKERSKLHSWYNYDTMLKFAEGYYVVHYNFCKYERGNTELSVRYAGPGHGHDHYIPVPMDKRIHLHDLNNEIRNKEFESILKKVEPQIINVSRAQWGLQ